MQYAAALAWLNSRPRGRILAVLAALASFAWANPPGRTQCPPTAGDCFSLAKSVVELVRAQRYQTVSFYETRGGRRVPRPVTPEDIEALGAESAVERVIEHPALHRFGVVLVEVARGTRADSLQPPSGTSGVVGSAEGGNPVYSTGAVQHVLVNEVIVQFENGNDRDENEALLRSVGARILVKPEAPDSNQYLVAFPRRSGSETRLLSNALDGRGEVAFAQPNFITFADRARGHGPAGPAHELACPIDHCPQDLGKESDDPHLSARWYLENTGSVGKAHADINARGAWKLSQGEADIVVAVLDDGVEMDHEDLRERIHSTWNAHTQSPALALREQDKHGTAAAGLVAAVAPEVKIMPVRVFDWTSAGYAFYPRHVIARGIKEAADTAHVLAMGWSLGTLPGGDPAIEDAIDYALSRNRVLVFAAGNRSGPVAYPARLSATEPIIAVSATDEWDRFKIRDPSMLCDWGSNYGPEIDVAAPGVNLYTIDRIGSKGYCSTGNYTASFGGTSGAAALVAGAAALILSLEPDLSPKDVRDRLRETAEDLGDAGVDEKFGHGRIDACRALRGTDCERPDGR